MTRSAKVLWLVLLLNVAMISGVVAYGLGNIPFHDYVETLKMFGLGALLSTVALTLANMAGMDARGEGHGLEEAPPRGIRLMIGVVGFGLLAVGLFVKGVISTASLLGS